VLRLGSGAQKTVRHLCGSKAAPERARLRRMPLADCPEATVAGEPTRDRSAWRVAPLPQTSTMMGRLSEGEIMKRLAAIVAFMLLTSAALADPQSEISAYRKSYGLSAVTVDPALTELASKQANAMAEQGALDHNVYAPFHSRLASYGTLSAAENIAMGTRTFEDTLAVWKSSSGHNANLLLRSATRIGVSSASSHGTTYWALILAAPREPNARRVNVLSIFPFVMLMRITP
jgi:uncharacterized protein YkwD